MPAGAVAAQVAQNRRKKRSEKEQAAAAARRQSIQSLKGPASQLTDAQFMEL